MKKFFGVIAVILGLVLLGVLSRACAVADRVADPDNIITNYEEFQNIYSTCNQICDNISALSLTKTDSSAFSKEERVLALENKLNRWIREYNSKSRQITRNLWKSGSLPHQLSRTDFNCN